MSEIRDEGCRCDFRTRMVGDGCDQCNPSMSRDLAYETIDDLERELREARAEIERLNEIQANHVSQLAVAALETWDRDKLMAEIERLRARLEPVARLEIGKYEPVTIRSPRPADPESFTRRILPPGYYHIIPSGNPDSENPE